MSELVKKNDGVVDVNTPEDVRSYFDALMAITPDIFKTDNYNICVYSPTENQPAVKIIRFCVEYQDKIFAIQDEIFFPNENTGGQVNFRFTSGLQFKEAPSKISAHILTFIAEFKKLSKVKGSFISVVGKEGNYGRVFESDGEKWVSTKQSKGDPAISAYATFIQSLRY